MNEGIVPDTTSPVAAEDAESYPPRIMEVVSAFPPVKSSPRSGLSDHRPSRLDETVEQSVAAFSGGPGEGRGSVAEAASESHPHPHPHPHPDSRDRMRPSEIRDAIIEIARRSDQIEQQLTQLDQY